MSRAVPEVSPAGTATSSDQSHKAGLKLEGGPSFPDLCRGPSSRGQLRLTGVERPHDKQGHRE